MTTVRKRLGSISHATVSDAFFFAFKDFFVTFFVGIDYPVSSLILMDAHWASTGVAWPSKLSLTLDLKTQKMWHFKLIGT